jgi:hypothetical protein
MYIYSIISDIYINYNKSTSLEKIGSTTNIECRKFEGLTFLPCATQYKWYIEIYNLGNFKCLIQLEHFIHNFLVSKKKHFNTDGGGKEFFNFLITDNSLDMIKTILNKNDIKYKEYTKDIFTKKPSKAIFQKYMQNKYKSECVDDSTKCIRTSCKKKCTCKDISYITITPISGSEKNKAYIDYEEQKNRYMNGHAFMWDDSKYNNSKVNDYFAFFLVESKKKPIGSLILHKILNIKSPENRLSSWHNNIGQANRNVLILSEPLCEISIKNGKN